MLNRQEKLAHERLTAENERLRKQIERLQKQLEKSQDTASDLALAIDDFESELSGRISKFKKKIVQITTGTSPEDKL